MSDPETLAVYARRAQDYARLTDGANTADPCLKAFIAALPPGSHALDLGCGPGAAAAQMAQAGLVVDAYDPVPEMVGMAKVHAGVTAHLATFHDLHARDHYDGIWANFSLLHAPRDELPDILDRIVKALKPGGRFHIAVKTGTGARRDTLGRLYTYFTESELIDLLTTAGLQITDKHEGCDAGLSGEEAPWIALAAHA